MTNRQTPHMSFKYYIIVYILYSKKKVFPSQTRHSQPFEVSASLWSQAFMKSTLGSIIVLNFISSKIPLFPRIICLWSFWKLFYIRFGFTRYQIFLPLFQLLLSKRKILSLYRIAVKKIISKRWFSPH